MSGPDIRDSDDLNQVLSSKGGSHRGTVLRWVLIGLCLLALVAAGVWYGRSDTPSTGVRYLTEPVVRGDLHVTVTATGTLQPTNQVEVGSELSGIIKSVFVEENDRVEVGQELARLDTTKLGAQVLRSRAALKSAEAKVRQAAASVREARANLARLRQVAELSGGKMPAPADIDAAEATLARADADQASAEAAVSEAQAALEVDETDLAKASIRSPINGIVLTRSVETGQTVAASLQAPVLFTLAEDLTQMELHVDVDEADVGQVREGQTASFNVDAYPDKLFPAQITRVSFGSQTVEGVVTYETVMRVENNDLSLRPGMTATADITVEERSGVLKVPNAALRFTPPQTATGNGQRPGGIISSLMPRPPRSVTGRRASQQNGGGAARQVWILSEGQPRAVAVTTGANDGRMTEIVSGGLEAGMAVIVDSESNGR